MRGCNNVYGYTGKKQVLTLWRSEGEHSLTMKKLYAHIFAAFAVVTDPFAPNIIKSVYYKYFIIVGTRMFISTGFAT